MVYTFFDNKFRDDTTHTGKGATLEASQRISEYQKLASELHRPITKKLKNATYTHHIEIIFGVLILQILLISKHTKGIIFLLCY